MVPFDSWRTTRCLAPILSRNTRLVSATWPRSPTKSTTCTTEQLRRPGQPLNTLESVVASHSSQGQNRPWRLPGVVEGQLPAEASAGAGIHEAGSRVAIDGALRLQESGERLMQQKSAEVDGGTTPTVQPVVAERNGEIRTVSAADDDRFDDDPFGLWGDDEETGTEPPEKPSRTPAEEFRIQRSKTVKMVEALIRAFDDLELLRKSPKYDDTAEVLHGLIKTAQNWPK